MLLGIRTSTDVFVTKLSSMNTLTGPASSSYSLVFFTVPTMNAAWLCCGTHTYLSAALKSSAAIVSLCASPSLGSDTVPSTRYASESALRFGAGAGVGGASLCCVVSAVEPNKPPEVGAGAVWPWEVPNRP